ncbi:MAG: 6-carboxytetrahydropterin synthase QueD [Armatimonadota bacterium]
MFEISVEDSFDSAHSIKDYNGNCKRLHGHTYKVTAFFRYKELQDLGFAFDFKTAKKILKEILSYLDHSYLNDLPDFKDINPTAETIAKYIYDKLKKENSNLHRVSVWETATSCATYFEDE